LTINTLIPLRCCNHRKNPRTGLRYRHNWADLLRLVDDLRRLAHDRTLDDADRARRIRDRFGEHDGRFDDDR
jgi:hypothetical protein